MIAWRGNLSLHVYMPDKPHKFRVKLFMLCDWSNGYCLHLKSTTEQSKTHHRRWKYVTLSWGLFKCTCEIYINYFVDNYYTSQILFHDLYQQQTGACRTMRVNHKVISADLKTTKLKKGEINSMTNGTLQVLKWKDKRYVHVYDDSRCLLCWHSQRVDRRTGEQFYRPACIVDSIKYMGAVDRCIQMIAYPAFKCFTLKWWKKVFFHLLMMATLNGYLLYKEHCAKWR